MKCLFKVVALSSLLFSGIIHAEIDGSAMAAALQKAQAVYNIVGEGDAAEVDWSHPKEIPGLKDPANPGMKLQVVEWEAFNPGYKTYHRIRVLVNYQGAPVGVESLYLGQ